VRKLALAAIAAAALVPSAARPDGCAPSVCGMASDTPPGSALVVLRPNGYFGPLQAFDVATGRARFTLPFGLASADGGTFLSPRSSRVRTTVVRYDARTGRRAGTWERRGGWWIGGLSANGRFAALVDARSSRKRTGIDVVASSDGRLVRRVQLGPAWEVETVSNDARRLFLIEHRRSGYRVRLYDLAASRLVPHGLRVVNENEPMRGWGVRAVATADGRWLLTLYVNGHEAFVHALDLRRALAVCLDLPGRALPRKLVQWGLALAPGGRALVAANPSLGAVVSIDLRTLRLRTLARFAPWGGRASAFTNAAVARDGRVAFGSVRATWVLERGRVRRVPVSGRVGGFGWGPDGRLTVVLTNGRALRL
jgi:hypothetical protein